MGTDDTSPDFISDDDWSKQQSAEAPNFISDDDWAKQQGQPPAENPHDFAPFLKNAWEGVKNTAEEFSNKPLASIAYDHVVQPAIDTFKSARDSGAGLGSASIDAANAALAPVADLGTSIVAPATMPASAFMGSMAQGNSVGDALKDARNMGVAGAAAGMLGPALGVAGDAASGIASKVPGMVEHGAGIVGAGLGGKFGGHMGMAAGLVAGREAGSALVKAVKGGGEAAAPAAPGINRAMIRSYGADAVQTARSAGIKLDGLSPEYAKTILTAAQQSAQKVAVAHYILSQKDEGYQQSQSGAEPEQAE